jgi:hypothetical protein
MKLKQLGFSNVTKPRANYLRRYGFKATWFVSVWQTKGMCFVVYAF